MKKLTTILVLLSASFSTGLAADSAKFDGVTVGSNLVVVAIRPVASNACDLGSAAFPFRRVYSSDQEYSFTIPLQDPANGLAYWMPNPFGSRSGTLAEVYAKAHGMTCSVAVVSQNRSDAWYIYNSVTNVAANSTGSAVALSSTVTNAMRIGFIPSGISAFATTNMLSVDFKFTVP